MIRMLGKLKMDDFLFYLPVSNEPQIRKKGSFE